MTADVRYGIPASVDHGRVGTDPIARHWESVPTRKIPGGSTIIWPIRFRAALPDLALGIVKSGAVVHSAGYGLADIQSGLPILPDTIFHLASCGKQFTALGILMLAEEGKLHPDDLLDTSARAGRFWSAPDNPALAASHLRHPRSL